MAAAAAPPAYFSINERVLCYHGPLIYEAKVLKSETWDETNTKLGTIGQHFFVHYKGWKQTFVFSVFSPIPFHTTFFRCLGSHQNAGFMILLIHRSCIQVGRMGSSNTSLEIKRIQHVAPEVASTSQCSSYGLSGIYVSFTNGSSGGSCWFE